MSLPMKKGASKKMASYYLSEEEEETGKENKTKKTSFSFQYYAISLFYKSYEYICVFVAVSKLK